MQYVDTASRDRSHALGTWLDGLSAQDIRNFRFQSGYFNADGLAPLAQLFRYLAEHDRAITCILGSNGGETAPQDIEILVDLIGCPRANARIAIVSYATGLYHPKVYHATRADGSQTAYVGSANLTSPGVSGLNIEAGLILDSADGDPEIHLTEIASTVETWFGELQDAVHIVSSRDDIPDLVRAGVLGQPRPPQPRRPASSATQTQRAAVRLEPLVRFPPISPIGSSGPDDSTSTGAARTTSPHPRVADPAARLSVPIPEVAPAYVLFAPGETHPTQGAEALTGSMLPGGATGLIVRLNRDSARHFEDRPGTANVSIPVPAIGTLRFGLYVGRYRRPRCEFPLRVRFIDDSGVRSEQLARTNIMVYGHAEEETGHGDIRMLVPRPPIRAIRESALSRGTRIPTEDDPMVLEWPTPADPSLKISFVDTNSQHFSVLQNALETAGQRGQSVGRGACWLFPGLVSLPSWNTE